MSANIVAIWDNRSVPDRCANTDRRLTHQLESTERQAPMKATQCSVDGCERDIKTRGWCRSHYRIAWIRGDFEPRPRPRRTVADRFASGLERKPNGCLEWTKCTNKDGYGNIRVGIKMVLTHRLAWELANGPIPDGLIVCHRCDNPPCCDAEKCLFLGTEADNAADREAKGRGRWGS